MKRTFLIALLLVTISAAAAANIADPSLGKKKSIDTSLSIRLDKNATEAKLIIPRAQLKQLRAELEQLDGGSDTTASVGTQVTRSQTIISGALFSLAFVFGGLWFIRSGKRSSRAIVASVLLLTTGSIATIVYGNAGPPPEARAITGKMFTPAIHMYKGGWGAIKLEVSDSDDETNPMLIVPDPPKTANE